MIALRDRMRLSPAAWAAIALALFVIAVAASMAVGSTSNACGSCHGRESQALATSSHASVSCYRCHLDAGAWSYPGFKADEVLRMYPGALLGSTGKGPATPLSSAPCISCHRDVMESEKPSGSGGLRILHSACAAGVATCDDCHSTTAHGRSTRNAKGPVMDDCITCHLARKAPTDCTTCHEGKLASDRIRSGVFAVTHGPEWKATHGLGNLATCEVCHTAVQCADCHATPVPHPSDFGRTHGSFAKRAPEDCKTCHREASFCSGCHKMPMPHPADFLKKHSKIATAVSDPRCMRCHDEVDCRRCHIKHVHPGGARGIPVPPRVPAQGGGS